MREQVDTVLGLVGSVDRSGVTLTSKVNGLGGDLNGFLEVLSLEEAENWAELLKTHWVGVADELVVALTDENLAWVLLGDGEASAFSDGSGRGTNGGWVHLADAVLVQRKAVLANLISLLGVHQIAATIGEFLLEFLIDGFNDNAGLLRGTNHTVIEGLGNDDAADSVLKVAQLVNDGAVVTRSDT